jgi:hypothetical protein
MLRFFRGWFVSTTKPASQPIRNLFGTYGSYYWRNIVFYADIILLPACANPKENSASSGSFMIPACTCYMLHSILVMIHFVLVISYISHWEHRVIIPFTTTNDNFWSVVLSASLQAFYTVRAL